MASPAGLELSLCIDRYMSPNTVKARETQSAFNASGSVHTALAEVSGRNENILYSDCG